MDSQHILIIGAGLAGTSLAHVLLEKGHQVKLVDRGVNHSTAIAAGMVNPMVFRRMNKSWRLDEFMVDAKDYYRKLEKKFDVHLFHPIVIRRMLSSEQERNYWLERSKLPEYQAYLTEITTEDESYSKAENHFGSGRLKASFWVDAKTYYNENFAYFERLGVLLKQDFDFSSFDEATLTYQGEKFDKVVFAVGYQQLNTPYFQDVPVQQTKGQTLRIRSNQLPENESLNRKCFVLPLGDQLFRIGATYEWDNPDLTPTEDAKQELLNHLSVLGSYSYEIIDQQVGVRPTVLDRRPILGEHHTIKNMFLFNGLGTKGYLMAPTLAKELYAHMFLGLPLNNEISIDRFYKKQSNSIKNSSLGQN
ncbi:MAG: NAD(P)/FAD-dependent oxidoreductase [Flavobacteriales bacterium]